MMEMSALKGPNYLEGQSLLPLLKDPKATWRDHTVTTFARGSHAITTKQIPLYSVF